MSTETTIEIKGRRFTMTELADRWQLKIEAPGPWGFESELPSDAEFVRTVRGDIDLYRDAGGVYYLAGYIWEGEMCVLRLDE